MRLGLSNKITQPILRGAVVTPPSGPITASLSFDLTTDTFERLENDGQYYNLWFPQDFVDWSGANSNRFADNSTTVATLVSDPFADYRTGTTPAVWTDAINNHYNALPPISAHLNITITVPSGAVLGSNTAYYALNLVEPSFRFWISDSTGTIGEESGINYFTEDAAENLEITIQNSGTLGGGGGIGGAGCSHSVVSGKDTTYSHGGGGAGGAGVHPASAATSSNNPGAPGEGLIDASDGTAGGVPTTYVRGAGGAAATTGANTATYNAKAGSHGGHAIFLTNGNHSVGPAFNITNEQGGYLYSGSGGGGGGGEFGFGTLPYAGGRGGGYLNPVSIVTAGAAGGGSDLQDGSGTDTNGGAHGTVGNIFSDNWNLSGTQPHGTITYTNNHTVGNTTVTMQGSEFYHG